MAEYVDNNLLTEDSDVLAGIQIKTYVAHGGDDGGAGGVYFDGQGGSDGDVVDPEGHVAGKRSSDTIGGAQEGARTVGDGDDSIAEV